MQTRVSVAELIDSDVPLRPDEAAAIVRDVCRQYAAGDLRGIPNPAVIRLTLDGAVVIEGPVSRDHAPVPAAAALLNALLPSFDSANGFKVPGGLRLALARATGTLDVPPFATAADFCAALERFAAPDLAATVRDLFRSWAARQPSREAAPSRELTISDIRRARRATGLSLEDVSRASGIPAAKLRELEWGYVRNWRADATGRDELCRYARGAGLDEALVASVAWPLLERDAASDPLPDEPARDAPGWGLVPSGSQGLVPAVTPRATHAPRYRWAFAIAAAVLLVIAILATGSERPASAPAVAEAAVPRRAAPPMPAFGDVQPASYTRVQASDRAAPARPRARKPAARPPRQPRRSFFEKELFRIVIR